MNLFTESGLKLQLISAITEIGYQIPTDIQKLTIPFLLKEKQDLIALAQTGTGKTAAFGLPILHQINEDSSNIEAIILCPTRELCLQITRDIVIYSSHIPKIRSLAVYGGSSITEQIRYLKKKPQIVIGTPGRLNDMIRRKVLNLSRIQWLVLDEADEMLSMGFKEELEIILDKTPEKKQILLFSATMSKSVEKIANGYMNKPHKIVVGAINAVKKNISHLYCITRYNQKLQVLHRILDFTPSHYTIIFCKTRIETQQVSDYLILQGFSADSLHGDLSQNQRDMVMKKFRYQNLKILVATDVAARGLDVNSLTHVIHFSLPDDPEIFVHRSGRTGRAGKYGQSISLIRIDEYKKIKRIEKDCSIQINSMNIPSNEQIIEIQVTYLLDKISNNQNSCLDIKMSNFPNLLEIKTEDLIKKFIFLHLNRMIHYYEKNPSIIYNAKLRDYNTRQYQILKNKNNKKLVFSKFLKGGKKIRDKKSFHTSNNYTQFFINLGKRDDLSKLDIFSIINKNILNTRVDVGRIDIRDKVSFFEVDSSFKTELLKNINNKSFNGKVLKIEEINN